MTDAAAAEWRERFISTIEAIGPEPEPVVLQSGGLDSLTITAALCSLGLRPRLVTFSIGGAEYPDLKRVRRVADRLDLPLTVVEIERTEERLVEDIRKVIALGATNKTHVQCWQPVAAMSEAIACEFGPSQVWMGTGGICEDSRSCVVAWKQFGEAAARAIRSTTLVPGGQDGTATAWMHRALTDRTHVVAEPYAHESFRSYSLALDLAEINRPRQKGIAVRAFRDWYVETDAVPPRNSSLQVGSGIREWHDTLLRSERYNPDGHKAVVAIYRRINDL